MRTGKRRNGQFDVQPGMAFIMRDMADLLPGRPEIRADLHPWLITAVDTDYVEIVMCSTLKSDVEDKNRGRSLDYDDTTDIPDGCPPMERTRESKASLNTFIMFPKKELFTHDISLLNDNTETRNFQTEGFKSLCLSEKVLTCIQDEINEYLCEHSKYEYDPFQCTLYADYLFDLEDGLETPKWFTKEMYEKQFGWKHIKPANENTVYPFEDKMHPYEKNDRRMLDIVRARDKKSNRPYQRQTEERLELTAEDLASIPMDDGQKL